jgi:hypothetical protein
MARDHLLEGARDRKESSSPRKYRLAGGRLSNHVSRGYNQTLRRPMRMTISAVLIRDSAPISRWFRRPLLVVWRKPNRHAL